MMCPRCGAEIPLDAAFCPKCGAATAGLCTTCSTMNAPGDRFCKRCGQPLTISTKSGAAAVGAPQLAAAERRQLTVMFCDLVGSTTLSERLDPEELRDLVRAYQQTCADVIDRFDGHIAQYLGDGLLVYFGYPRAHEDDAQRAVRAGLGMLEGVRQLNTRLESQHGIRLAIRLGVHTGLVVVGEVGGGSRQEQLALGETPNVAARLQAIAAVDSLLVSAATFRLLGGFFACQPLGTPPLKGLAQPLEVYRVLYESMARTRLEAAGNTALTPFVGREQEIRLLRERWELVKDGVGRVLLLSGEAGIGKSRLVQVLKDQLATEPMAWLIVCQCSPYHQHSALYPIIEWLERVALRFQRDDSPAQKLNKLEAFLAEYGESRSDAVPLFASMLSVPLSGAYPPISLSPEQQKRQTFHALLMIFLRIAIQQPVLLVVEDLHWVDPSTLEFLSLVVDQGPTARILALWTLRPDFSPPWTARGHVTLVTINRLPRREMLRLIHEVAHGKSLPAEVVEQIVAKTDGVPLFVEELTKMIVESGLLHEHESSYALNAPLPPLAIPATLHDSLMARLDRLRSVKALAQLCATLGREFSYALVRAVAPWDERTVQQGLQQLVDAEFLYQRRVPPEATYTFKHALIRDVAYQSLLRSTRQQNHQRIARALEGQFPEIVQTQPELVAQHYTAAGFHEDAIVYWLGAARQASDRSAHLEAIAHSTTGIGLVASVPETPEHLQQALSLHIALGAALQMTKGNAAPEVEQVYTQARGLCQKLGDTPALVPVLFGLWRFSVTRAHIGKARELAQTLLRLAQRTDDPVIRVAAHVAMGATRLFLGELSTAREHLMAGFGKYTPDQRRAEVSHTGQDLGVACQAYAAWTLWLLGYPEQAVTLVHAALSLAHQLSHPYSVAYAHCWAAIVAHFRRDVRSVCERAEHAVALSTERGFTVLAAMASSLRGWALAMQGQDDEGLREARRAMTALKATGTALFMPYFCGVLAEIAAHIGDTPGALGVLTEAQTLLENHDERYWEAEVFRLRSVLLPREAASSQHQAETLLRHAVDVARYQQAKSLELRAAMSLSHLWLQQGKRAAARAMLEPVYAWFTEGLDTGDLREARALLRALA
jgi:class 3 adenylate cyclase/predicted ATPase